MQANWENNADNVTLNTKLADFRVTEIQGKFMSLTF